MAYKIRLNKKTPHHYAETWKRIIKSAIYKLLVLQIKSTLLLRLNGGPVTKSISPYPVLQLTCPAIANICSKVFLAFQVRIFFDFFLIIHIYRLISISNFNIAT